MQTKPSTYLLSGLIFLWVTLIALGYDAFPTVFQVFSWTMLTIVFGFLVTSLVISIALWDEEFRQTEEGSELSLKFLDMYKPIPNANLIRLTGVMIAVMTYLAGFFWLALFHGFCIGLAILLGGTMDKTKKLLS